MNEPNTKSGAKKIPEKALEYLRSDAGAFARVARRVGRSRSHICKVASGARKSDRVRRALIREAVRLAKLQGYKVAIELEEHTNR